MKYNKIEIMRNANKYAKSIGRCAALRKAWAEAKMGKIDEQLFLLEMKDHWNNADYAYIEKLHYERAKLNKIANPNRTREIINPAIDVCERLDMEDEIKRLRAKCKNFANPDRDEYVTQIKKLESRLYITVAA